MCLSWLAHTIVHSKQYTCILVLERVCHYCKIHICIYINHYFYIRQLADMVLGVLTCAHSTAAVERCFSLYSCIRTKQRNRLMPNTVDSILRLRTYLHTRGKCCKIEVTQKMLDGFKSDNMYTKQRSEGSQNTDDVVAVDRLQRVHIE